MIESGCSSASSRDEILQDHGWTRSNETGLYSHEALSFPKDISESHAFNVHNEMVSFMCGGDENATYH